MNAITDQSHPFFLSTGRYRRGKFLLAEQHLWRLTQCALTYGLDAQSQLCLFQEKLSQYLQVLDGQGDYKVRMWATQESEFFFSHLLLSPATDKLHIGIHRPTNWRTTVAKVQKTVEGVELLEKLQKRDQQAFDDYLLFCENQEVIEGAIHSVVFYSPQEGLVLPQHPLALESLARQALEQSWQQKNISYQKRAVFFHELESFESIWFVNAVWGARAVAQLAEKKYKTESPLDHLLQVFCC